MESGDWEKRRLIVTDVIDEVMGLAVVLKLGCIAESLRSCEAGTQAHPDPLGQTSGGMALASAWF